MSEFKTLATFDSTLWTLSEEPYREPTPKACAHADVVEGTAYPCPFSRERGPHCFFHSAQRARGFGEMVAVR